MTISLKHQFTSNVADSGDTTLVQPSNWNAEHTLTAAANTLLGAVSAGAVSEITCTAAGRAILDDADAAAQRTTLGLGTIATQNANNVTITGGSVTGITDLAIADGGTGASTAAAAATNLGLGTGDSPQFLAVNIGNATDTTITRVSAGVIAVEGKNVALNGTGETLTTGIVVMGSSFLRNKIINGAMVIDQRNAGASIVAGGVFATDRWRTVEGTDGAATAQQVTDAPTGFNYSLKWTTTTADSNLTTTQGCWFSQDIEGYNISEFNFGTASATNVTISFWVKSSLTGTFGGAIRNGAATRSYPFTYTISSANTWEYKTVTIPGDTTGTWATDSSAGMNVFFGLGVGPTYSGTANTWNAGNFVTPTGAVSVIGTLNATWLVTGVQLEVGSSATPFERRQYGQELALCQRYYYKIQADDANTIFGSGFCDNTTGVLTYLNFPTQMRVTPTALEQSGTAGDYRIRRSSATNTVCSAVPLFAAATQTSAWLNFTVASSLTAGTGAFGRANSSAAYLAWSAEF